MQCPYILDLLAVLLIILSNKFHDVISKLDTLRLATTSLTGLCKLAAVQLTRLPVRSLRGTQQE